VHPVVRSVTVETDGADALVVSWELDGPDDGTVDVAVGGTPEAIDHRHAITVAARVGSTRLDGVSGRTYVSVAPHGGGSAVVAADRRVAMEGLQNFRDLGGYRTATGGRTRWGKVFRADSLHKLTTADVTTYHALGMRTVFDLRRDAERERDPNYFDDAIQLSIIGHPPEETPDGSVRIDVGAASIDVAGEGERILRDLYVGMLLHSAPLFGRLLTALTDPDRVPAVFHCHAGKDRTGMVAALLLDVLGVGRDDILDDYELTRRYRTFDLQQDSYARLMEAGLGPEAAAGVLATPRWAMAETLDVLADEHGGVEAYLTGPAGMPSDALDALRAMLVVPHG
jgi:protein-tyrosine phosphatase